MSFSANSTVLTFFSLNSRPIALSLAANFLERRVNLDEQAGVLKEELLNDGLDAEGFLKLR